MARYLIIFVLAVVLVGIFWPYLRKVGLGRLPGDAGVERRSGSYYYLVATCVVLSLILSLILSLALWLVGR